MKIPKTLGACADRLYTIKQEKSELNKQLEALDEERKALEAHVIENLPKSQATGISGAVANVKVVSKDVPTVKDWDKLYAHIKKTNDFSLLQRRVGDGAIKERWEAGKKVPGVEPFTVVTVSVTKV